MKVAVICEVTLEAATPWHLRERADVNVMVADP